jgi:Reverse transcriptase (RNA-dependent DNA polymerase)
MRQSAVGVLEALLGKGYLPVQLPPGFSSATFASELSKYQLAWEAADTPPPTLCEKFSIARSSYYRRSTAIVNPIGFYFLAKEVATYWPQIEAHYKKSQLSRSVPTFGTSLRAIDLPKFSELYEEKVTSSAGYKYALVTDITSFFPTVYTHTIPWALHTKEVAKSKKGKAHMTPTYYGNILDAKCMGVQDGQTIGLPIGPDTSHIIAEIIGVAIDERLKEDLGVWPKGFRYVDDFFLFFDRRDEAEKALATIIKAVSSYELQINPAKTRIIEVKELVEESWKYGIKRLMISSAKKQQRDDIHHYFEVLFSLEKRFKDESLVKYGLKQLSSTIVKTSNWPVLEAYLLKCGYGFPNTIQVIAHILATYHYHGYPLNTEAIARFCNNLIGTSAVSDHHGEVSWLLWICKALSINLERDVVKEVERMASPVCTLLLLDLHNAGIVTDAPSKTFLSQFAVGTALTGPGWLLAYEAGRRKRLGNKNIKFISNHPYFGPLCKARVAFYDEHKKVTPIFDFKEVAPDDSTFDFDSDKKIEDDFKFDEMDEEYFDSVDSNNGDLP